MFVVTPFLASQQNYFGIYSFVVSLGLFLAYTDFGFLTAGAKFAAEAFIKNNRKREIEIFGFVTFIMAIFFSLFAIIVLVFRNDPSIILKNIDSRESELARDLFLAFLIGLPITLANRILILIYSVRLHDYKYQRITALMNMLKIVSVFFFFNGHQYRIQEFYWFTQVLTLATVVIGVLVAIKTYSYNFISFGKNIRFNRKVFNRTKSLAFSSLFVTISWVIYYELDSLIIGKFVGLKEVAIFNICISLMTFARSLYGIIYGPFSAKFNHYIGANQLEEFKRTFSSVLVLGLPLALLPTGILLMSMSNFIISWVGEDYVGAIPIATMMFASYLLNFVSYPAGIAMLAKQKIKEVYLISFILPVVYWIGILAFFPSMGLNAFGLFKLIAFLISGLFYFFFSSKNMDVSWTKYFKENGFAVLGSMITIGLMTFCLRDYLPVHKEALSLLYYGIFFLFLLVVSGVVFLMLSTPFRKQLSQIKSRL